MTESTTYYALNEHNTTGCRSAVSSKTITIKSVPSAPVLDTTYSYCIADGARQDVTLQATSANVCYWYDANYTLKSNSNINQCSVNGLTSSTTYYVAAELDGCYSDTVVVPITINVKPGVPTVSNISLCAAGDVELTGTPGANGDMVHWYNGSTPIASPYNVTGDVELTAKTYNTSTGCESDGRSVMVTIRDMIDAPTAAASVYACGGNAVLTATPAAGATLKWYDGSHAALNNFDGTVSGIASDTTYYVTSLLNGCESAETGITVTPAQNPSEVTASTESSICQGSDAVLTAEPSNGCVLRWYEAQTGGQPAGTANSYTVSAPAVGQHTYYVAQENTTTGCVSARTGVSFTVNANPSAPVLSPETHCGTWHTTLTANPAEGCTVRWYSDANATQPLGSVTVDVTESTTYYALNEHNTTGCRSAVSSKTITIYPIPAVPQVSGETTLCAGNSTTLTASTDNITVQCRWQLGNTTQNGVNYTTPVLEQSATVYVTAVGEHCNSTELPVEILVNPNPQNPVVSSVTSCQGTPVTIMASSEETTECHWYADAQTSTILANTDSYTPAYNQAGVNTYYVSIYNTQTHCESGRTPVTATFYPIYSGINFDITSCDSYTWNNETFDQSGNYERTLHTIHGCDSVVTLNLTINRSKTTDIDTTVCDNFVWNNTSYNQTAHLSYTYTAANGCDSVVNVNLTVLKSTTGTDRIYVCSNAYPVVYHGVQISAAGPYSVTIENAVGCDSVITLTVVTNPQPTVPAVTSDQRCAAGELTLRVSGGANGTQYNWYDNPTDGSLFHTGANYTLDTSASVTFYVSYYNHNTGCESQRVPVTATVNPNPELPVVSQPVRCGEGSVTFNATVDANAQTCRWYPTRNSTTLLATALSYQQDVNATGIACYVEAYNPTTGCRSDRSEVSAVVRDIPAEPTLSPMSNCGPMAFAIAAPATGYYTWHNSDIITDQSVTRTDTQYVMPLISATTSVMVGHAMDYDDITCESATAEQSFVIYPVYEPLVIRDTLCQNGTYIGYGIVETFDTPGSYARVINTQSSNGCDSLVTLVLEVKDKKFNNIAEEVCDEFVWNNVPYTTSGVYQQTFTASNGCDSVVTLNLIVNYATSTQFEVETCDSYTWNNETYNTSGDYVQHFQTIHGCDSTVTLHLTLHYATTNSFEEVACDSYTWNNETYQTSGEYVQHFQTVYGCDSTVTLNLTVNYSNRVEYSDEICAEDHYVGYGFDTTIVTDGIYTLEHYNYNVKNCDSVTVLTLTVHSVYRKSINTTICETATYNFNGRILNEAGTYLDTLSTVYGCDSMFTLTLSIASEYRDTIHADICQYERYTQNGFDVDATGFYTQNLHALNGCDSVVVLDLTVHNLDTTYLTDAVCQNGMYDRYGFTDVSTQTPGVTTYERVVPTRLGCDSTVYLTLTVNPTYDLSFIDTICLGEHYTLFDFDTLPATAGTHIVVRTLTTDLGCDSIRTLTLVVNPTYTMDEYMAICEGDTFIYHNERYTAAGDYPVQLQTVAGCDSLVTLHLMVNPTYAFRDTMTLCDSELPYNWHGTDYEQAGIYYDNHQTVNGCDSNYTLVLNVNPTYRIEYSDVICNSETPYSWRGNTFSVSGIYYDSLHTVVGCDSVYVLNLTVNPTYSVEEHVVTCDNQPYVWEGHPAVTIPEMAGDYELVDTLPTIHGCDSVCTLYLTVNETYHHHLYEEICFGDVYSFHGTLYDETGEYSVTLNSNHNCDSVVPLHLTVNPVYTLPLTVEVCEGALPYVFNDTVILTESSMRTIHLYTDKGCDSIINLNFIVRPYERHTDEVTICDDQLPYQYQDSLFTQAGVYDVMQSFADGCNIITTLTLNVNPTFLHYDTVYACENKLPYVYDANLTLHQAGTDTAHYSSLHYCDSLVVVTLVVEPNPVTTDLVYVCPTAMPFQYGDSLFGQPGTYRVIFARENQCDSMVDLTLELYPTYYTESLAVTCDNVPYVWENHPNVTIPTLAGDYILWDSLHTVNDCDSVFKLALTIYPTYYEEAAAETCDNVPYVWENHPNVIVPTVAGEYILWDSLKTVNDCDSVFKLTLTVHPTYLIESVAETCDNVPYVWENHPNVIVPTTAGEYILWDSLKTVNHCDSIYKLTLTVHPTFYTEATAETCDNVPYVWESHPNVTIPTAAGEYILWDSLRTVNQCDSVYKLTLTVHPTYYTEATAETCDNEPYVWENHPNVTIPTAAGEYILWDSLRTTQDCDSVFKLTLTVHPTFEITLYDTVCSYELPYLWRGREYAATGVYYDSLKTINHCDSVYVLNLMVNPSHEYVTPDYEICAGETFVWRNYSITEEGLYTDTVTNVQTGCYDVYKVRVIVYPTYMVRDTVEVCDNELPYFWHGSNRTQAGTYYDNHQTVHGCDSNYTLLLIVHPTYYFPGTAETCDNEPYVWENHPTVTIPTTAGTYILWDSLKTVNECDSVFKLTLTVHPTYYTEATAETCDNEPYVWEGHPNVTIPTAAGEYILWDSLRTANYCDSVFKLTLTVHQTYLIESVAETCDNEPYVWENHPTVTIPTSAGTYILWDSLRTTNYCDSVYKLTLTIHPTHFIESVFETCDNAPYVWNGHPTVTIPTEVGTYVLWDSLKTTNACDSIYRLTLTIHPTYMVRDTVEVCDNELPYFWHGSNRTQAGTYYDNHQTVHGCDSNYTLLLIVHPTYLITESATICSVEAPYTWRDMSLTTTGVYYDTLRTSTGCDSIYKLTLTVNPNYTYEEADTVCSGDLPYLWRNRNINTPGVHTDTVTNIYGCSDIYYLTLTVNQVAVTTIMDTICFGDAYHQNGFDTVPQTYGTLYDQHILTTTAGCDSIVNLILTINRTYQFVSTETTCDNSPFVWRGHEYSTTGIYYDNFTTVSGCDSIYVLNLTVNPTYTEEVVDSVIVYQTYSGYGMEITPTEVGVLHYPIQYYTEEGCDSIVNLTLYVTLNVGVEEYTEHNRIFTLYPNPTQDVLNIRGEDMERILVYDGRGRLLRMETPESDTFTRIQLGQYAAGYYVIRIQLTDGQYVNKKVMVRP